MAMYTLNMGGRQIQQSEATAARRIITNVVNTHEAQTVTVSKNGGSFGATAGSTNTQITGTIYKLEIHAGDLDTLGEVAFLSTGATDSLLIYNIQVVEDDPHEVADATAAKILATPANLLATDASGYVTTGALAEGAVTATAIASNAITADKIASNAIAAAKIADSAITAAKIASDAITSAKIADGALTADKIASNAITSAKIADGTLTADKIASAAITAAKIATDAVGSDELATTAVTEINAAVTEKMVKLLRTTPRS